MLRTLLPALCAVLGLTCATAQARPFDEVVADGRLRVALYEDNAPFSAMKDGKPYGIDVDLAQAIADHLKLKLDLRIVDAGENVDGDLRLNLWRGDLAGTALADLMLHVPNDKLLALRNEQVFFTRPYFDQRIGFAWRPGPSLPDLESLEALDEQTVAVEGNSASDLILLMAGAGRYRDNLRHFPNFEAAAKAFLGGETPILAGTRPAVEATCHASGRPAQECRIAEIALGGAVKTHWELAGAVRSDSRDLGYAVGEAITALAENGTLQSIFAKYGVTFAPPKGY